MAKRRRRPKEIIQERLSNAVRQVAVEIMNDLAEAGPHWSGNFKNSWVADAPGYGGSLGKTQGRYPYKLNDVAKFKGKTSVNNLRITNTSIYALYAMDLKEGVFWPNGPLKGSPYAKGTRKTLPESKEGIRGDVSSSGSNDDDNTAISTAPKDWFITYIDGGGLRRSLKNGITFGFRAGLR